jgi:hypothetical protein
MPGRTTVSAFLIAMVMPLTEATATGLMAATAIARVITAIMVIDHQAITATDIARVITAEAGKAIAGPAMVGEAQAGKDTGVGGARACRGTAGAELQGVVGGGEDVEADAMRQASCQCSSAGKAKPGSPSPILVNKEMTMTTGRLLIASMMLAALFLSEGAIARDGGHQGDRSTDVSGSGSGRAHERAFDNGHSGNSNASRKGHARAERFGPSRRHDHDRADWLKESPYSRPSFYYWPYYTFQPYSAPPAVTPFSPPAYIDQGTVLNIQSFGPNSTDYCSSPTGYYPYVQECPTGWRRMDPQQIEQQPGYRYYCTNPTGSYPYNRECSSVWRNVVP